MFFLKCQRSFLRMGVSLMLFVSSAFLVACSDGSGGKPSAGIESTADTELNSEEETKDKQWNKMNWSSGTWG